MLDATARDADAAVLQEMMPRLLEQHRQMDADWLIIKSQLDKIATGTDTALSASTVEKFVADYTAHMEQEEQNIAPMAKRLFSPAQMRELGDAMQTRRGIAPAAETAVAVGVAAAPVKAVAAGIDIADLRLDYGRASLDEADTLEHPVDQFAKWFDEAMKAEVFEANAMSVATVGADGKPSSRIVLIKQYDQRGFTWYTNCLLYTSPSPRDLSTSRMPSSA